MHLLLIQHTVPPKARIAISFLNLEILKDDFSLHFLNKLIFVFLRKCKLKINIACKKKIYLDMDIMQLNYGGLYYFLSISICPCGKWKSLYLKNTDYMRVANFLLSLFIYWFLFESKNMRHYKNLNLVQGNNCLAAAIRKEFIFKLITFHNI